MLSLVDPQKSIKRRSVNFLGTGLKSLFGVMDHDDDVSIQNAIHNITATQNSLQDIVHDEFDLIKTHNVKVKLNHENQEHVMENLMELRKDFVKNNIDVNSSLNKVQLTQALLLAEDVINSIDVQVVKLHNAILFAKAGVLDPFLNRE